MQNKTPGGTRYNGLYREAPPERGTFFRLQVYKRVRISQVKVYKRVTFIPFLVWGIYYRLHLSSIGWEKNILLGI